mmetsp:Transcript_79462/g.219810  ORF Transcript_79462/g.219810 Transcript_79462/m.219810 type:complete len:204 (-) Transcript_79462:889-1500(-)
MSIHEDIVNVLALHCKHLPKALVNECVLEPSARAVTLVLEKLLAVQRAGAPLHDRFAGEHLQPSVQAPVAVVQVHAVQAIPVLSKDIAETRGEEDGVGLDLDCPIVVQELLAADNLPPNYHEDVDVQRSLEVPALVCPEVALDKTGADSLSDLNALIAVQRVRVASEDAGAVPVLQLCQPKVVTPWQYQGEAEQRGIVLRPAI